VLLTEERAPVPVGPVEDAATTDATPSSSGESQPTNKSLRRLQRLASDLDAVAVRVDELSQEREAALAALDQTATAVVALRQALLDPPF
jgi:hypothetical protein